MIKKCHICKIDCCINVEDKDSYYCPICGLKLYSGVYDNTILTTSLSNISDTDKPFKPLKNATFVYGFGRNKKEEI